MATVPLQQFSFNRGEVEPALHSRSDWQFYYAAAAKMENLFARTQGGAIKRPGLKVVDYALSQDAPSWFIQFEFSTKQTYLLEFGDFEMRILKDGELAAYPEGHEKEGEIVVVPTPYGSDVLPLLRHAQVADTMYMVVSSHRPRRLMRYDHHDWRFDDIDFGQSSFPPASLRLVKDGLTGASYCVTAFQSATDESPPSDVVTSEKFTGSIPTPADVDSLTFSQCREVWSGWWGLDFPSEWDIWSKATPYDPAIWGRGYIISNSVEFDASGWMSWIGPTGYKHITKNTTANTSYWLGVMLGYVDAGYGTVLSGMRNKIREHIEKNTPDGKSLLEWEPVEGAINYRVFRRSLDGSDFYWIGDTTETSFEDDSLPYDSSIGLPSSDYPFQTPGDFPGAVTFFEQRIIYARTDGQPTTLWGSVVGDYTRFTVHTPIEDSDSYEFTLSSGTMNAINWMVPSNELLIGTSGSEWKAGGGSYAITPTNINARPQSFFGCAELNPVTVGRSVVFVSRSTQNVRTFTYSLEADGYAGDDITYNAGHLFDGKTIVSLNHQGGREGIIWVVQSDGSLLSGTYNPDENVIAWTHHVTDGRFESCGTIKTDHGDDLVYFCVAREIGGQTRRFIETLADMPIESTKIEDMAYLDCSISGTFPEPVGAVYGLDHLEGKTVSVLADGNVINGLAVVDGRIEFPDGHRYSKIHAGLPYTAELATMELQPQGGGSLAGRPRWLLNAAIHFFRSRECVLSVPGSENEIEFAFRTEEFDKPIQPHTGEKFERLSMPPDVRTTALRLICRDPVPFGVLFIGAEAGYGSK